MSTRRQLIATLTEGVSERGYRTLPGPNAGAAVVWFRREGPLVLLLGLEFSTRYRERFTSSFYLSLSTEWAYVPTGFPREAYERVGSFLVPEERAAYLPVEFSQPGVVDAWWEGFGPESAAASLRALDLCEPRFLAQPGLEAAVLNCASLALHVAVVAETVSMVGKVKDRPGDLQHQPQRRPDLVPDPWYWAAEQAVREKRPALLTVKYVGFVALDAWRQHQIAIALG